MIPIHQASLAILAAAASEIAVGFLWYSDFLFGPLARSIIGKSKKTDMSKEILLHVPIAIIKATGLFIAISTMQSIETTQFSSGFGKIFSLFFSDIIQHDNTLLCSVKTAGFIWLAFLLPTRAACTIWGNKNWKKLILVASGQFVMTMAMAVTIAFVS